MNAAQIVAANKSASALSSLTQPERLEVLKSLIKTAESGMADPKPDATTELKREAWDIRQDVKLQGWNVQALSDAILKLTERVCTLEDETSPAPDGFVELRSELCNVRANVALKKEIADTKANGEYLGRCSRGHRVELDVLKKNAEAVHADVKRHHVRLSVQFDVIQLLQKDVSDSRDLIRALIERMDKLEFKPEFKPEVKPAGIQVGDILEAWNLLLCGWQTFFTITSMAQVDTAQKRCLGGDDRYRVIRRTATGFDIVAGNKMQW